MRRLKLMEQEIISDFINRTGSDFYDIPDEDIGEADETMIEEWSDMNGS